MPGASSGGYLPPVVATLVGEAADALLKIEEVKLALADLQKSATDIPITANASEALAVIAAARATMNAEAVPPITFTIAINSAQALAELAVIRAIAGITIPVSVDMGPAAAEFAAGAVAMKATAASVGKGGGLLALLGWGGGLAGFAAFGSILSLAGAGIERLATTVIGLAGSLAGALAGGALLAAGALSKMTVGMGSDMLVMKSALTNTTNIATAQLAYNAAVAQYGPNSAQAVAALGNYKFAISQLPVAMQQSTVALATMLNQTKAQWQQATAVAQVAAQGIITQVLLVAQTYIPLIAAAAQKNFALISAALMPFFAWLKGPAGMGIFKNLESMFATSLPSAMMAFTNGVELLLKILNYAAGFTGTFLANLALWLQKMNNAPPSTWQTWVNTLIGMFRTWWALLKQVAITLYDLFSQSVGLGTTLVATITQMLVKLDAWLVSTSGKAQVHNLFQVHLQEILAILAVLPQVIGTFGQLYLAIAPPLVVLVTGLANMVGWMLKVPVAGPILAWAAAILLLTSRMNLLAISLAAIAGIKNLLTLFQALVAGGTFRQAFTIAFGSQSVAAQMQAASSEFAAAVTRFAAAVVGADAGAAGGAAAGAGGGAAEGGILAGLLGRLGAALGSVVGVFSALGAGSAFAGAVIALAASGPTILMGLQIHAQASLTDLQKLEGAYGLSATQAAIVAGFLSTATPQMKAQFASIVNSGNHSAASMVAAAQYLTAAQAAASVDSALMNTSNAIVRNGLNNVALNLILWGSALLKAGVSGGVAMAAQVALTAFIAKNGPPTALEMGVFNAMARNTSMSATTMAADVAAVSAFVHAHGPLTTAEMYAIQIQLNHGQTSAFDIALSLQTMVIDMRTAVQSAAGIAAALASLHNSIPGTINLTGGGKGFFAEGGVSEAPMSGGLAVLHGTEAIVPKNKAGAGLWGLMMAAIAGGGPREMASNMGAPRGGMGSAASVGLRPLGIPSAASSGGSGGIAVQVGDIHVTVPPGTPTGIAQQVGALSQQAVNKGIMQAVRQMRGGARTYGFMPS